MARYREVPYDSPLMKHFLLAILLGVFSLSAFGQTGSNPCNASSTYTACSSPTSTTMLNSWYSGSGASTYPSCGVNTTSGQYWVKYTATATYDFIRIGAARPGSGGSRIDNPAFEVYTMTAAGSCPSTQPTLSLVSCVNDNTGTTSEYYYMTVTSGTTYYIRFFDGDGSISGGGSGGNFQYCITESKPGDFVCNAMSIGSLPFNYSGNTTGYSNYAQSPLFSPNIYLGCSGKDWAISQGPDMFFSYNSPGNEWIRVNLSGTSTSIYAELSILKTSVSVCAQSVLGNTQYASLGTGYGFMLRCYDPPTSTFGGGFMAPSGVDSSICRVIYIDSAGTYFFRMDADLSSNTTPFTIDIESYTPSNGDACTNAVVLSDNVTRSCSNENCNYSWGPDDPDPADLCAGTIENTMWMKFTSDGTGGAISISLFNIACDNADVVATGPPWGWYNYADAWQFGVVTGPCGGPYTSVGCQSGSASVFNTSFTPTPNTTYYLVMDGNGGAECAWDINVSGITLLPSEMLYFSAVPDHADALLTWEAIHEENTSHYELEYSTNGRDYLILDQWTAQGAIESPSKYSYLHHNPTSELNYYRLKQVDFNGDWVYSPVRMVRFSAMDGAVEIFPVPASDQLSVVYRPSKKGNQTVRLITTSGFTVWQTITDFSASNILRIPVSMLSPGLYFVEVQKADGVYRQQVVIQ